MIVVTAITAQLTILPLGAATFQGTVLQTTEVVIPDGTEFTVVTIEEITSKTATEGDPISFKVDEDVKVNGHIVIAKDTLVKGTVASAKKSGFFGRGGHLGIRIESTMTVDSQKVKLRSVKGKEGGDKTGTTWETKLTYQKSCLARLNYVHQNPVKHGLVVVANQYPWCSARWFERIARPAQVKTIYSIKIDRLKVYDEYETVEEW